MSEKLESNESWTPKPWDDAGLVYGRNRIHNLEHELVTARREIERLRGLIGQLCNDAQTCLDNAHWEVRFGSGDLLATIKSARATLNPPRTRE